MSAIRLIVALLGSCSGIAGLLGFGWFLWHGALNVVDLGLSPAALLLLNTALSLLFFIQHSGMIRTRFRQWLKRFVPEAGLGMLYTTASGLTLILFVLLWQPADVVLYSATGTAYWILRGVFLAAGLAMIWGVRAVQSFDLFGLSTLSNTATPQVTAPNGGALQIRGPYRWVRHPMYSLSLVLIWSQPHLSLDRCLFNGLWTVWIIIGAHLEERDLVAKFGDAYHHYQRRVPMLMPSLPRQADLE